MSMPRIDELHPEPRTGLDREALAARYGRPGAAGEAPDGGPWIRMNFVSTLDGSATGADGRSGTISSAVDKAVFGVLRRLADVVLVGAGTVRHEGYEGPLVSPGQREWRLAHGLAEHPGLAIVSGRLDLDPGSPLFAESPVRPIVLTVATAPAAARAALSEVAELVDCGEVEVEGERLRRAFADRGWTDVLCEGGPSLFGAFAAQDVVDELCLTIEPRLRSGVGPRIAHGAPAEVGLRLAHVLHGESDELVLRYVRG
ncbi:MAG: hypothetical protein BGO95_10140 [Micrococcales bacterium 73-13]|nr:MAG: hypothetical protein BGO95_10140 [Micrococcales bacterium 73-13]